MKSAYNSARHYEKTWSSKALVGVQRKPDNGYLFLCLSSPKGP